MAAVGFSLLILTATKLLMLFVQQAGLETPYHHLPDPESPGAPVETLAVASASREVDAPISPHSEAQVLERGEYLVSRVAVCGQCHADAMGLVAGPTTHGLGSRRNHPTLTGVVGPDDKLINVSLPETPPETTVVRAPSLLELGSLWDEADVVELLQFGRTRDGYAPPAPMPRYGLHKDDAVAVARFLKSLPE